MSRRRPHIKPFHCDCSKLRHRSEADALRHIERNRGHYPDTARAYKCPGHSCWHVSTRGFHPQALKTRHRVLAWWLTNRRVIDTNWLRYHGIGVEEGSLADRRLGTAINQLVVHGLIERAGPRLEVRNPAGLSRIMAAGWDEYLAEHAATTVAVS